jgi:hypothetical protein
MQLSGCISPRWMKAQSRSNVRCLVLKRFERRSSIDSYSCELLAGTNCLYNIRYLNPTSIGGVMKRFFMRRRLLVPALLVAATVTADTLVLRDGRRVEGQLISIQNGVIIFDEEGSFAGGGRRVSLTRDEVLGIEFDQNRSVSRFPGFPGPPPTSQGGRPSGLRERQVMVAANLQWIDTNIDVRAGQDIYFEASGEVRWGPGRHDGPAGEPNSPVNPNRPIPNRPGAALIGRVGDTGNFYIGADRGPIRMRSSGRLFLGINDDNLQDNSGSFRVVVYY